MNRYIANFKSVDNKEYKILIGTSGFSPLDTSIVTNVIELKLSSEPVMITTSSDGLFSPLKYRSCTVSIVTDTFYFDMYSSRPKDTTLYVLNEDDEIIFFGYLTPNVYSQEYKTLDILELEFIESFSILDNYDYPKNEDDHMVSFADIVLMATDLVGCSKTHEIVVLSEENYLTKFYINDNNFFDDSEDKKPWTIKEVLSEICKFCCYTMCIHKNKIFFIDYNWLISHNSGFIFKNDIWYTIQHYTVVKDIDASYYRGAGATISLDETFNKITCTANTYPIDELISDVWDEKNYYLDMYNPWPFTYDNQKIYIAFCKSLVLNNNKGTTIPTYTAITKDNNYWYQIQSNPSTLQMIKISKTPIDKYVQSNDIDEVLCMDTCLPSSTFKFHYPWDAGWSQQKAGLLYQWKGAMDYFCEVNKDTPVFYIKCPFFAYSSDTDRYIVINMQCKYSGGIDYSNNKYNFDVEGYDLKTIKNDIIVGKNWTDSKYLGFHILPVRISIGDKYYVYNIGENGVLVEDWFTKEEIKRNGYLDYAYINFGNTEDGDEIKLKTNEWMDVASNWSVYDEDYPDADGGRAFKLPANSDLCGELKIEFLTPDRYYFKYDNNPDLYYAFGTTNGSLYNVWVSPNGENPNDSNTSLILWDNFSAPSSDYIYLLNRWLPTHILMKDLEIELVGSSNIKDSFYGEKTDDIEYTNIINESYAVEFDDIELKINTQDKSKKPSLSSVYTVENGLSELTKITKNGKSQLQEEHIIEQYANHYKLPKRIVEFTSRIKEDFPSPVSICRYPLFSDDAKYIVDTLEHDIRNESISIKIVEI